MRRPEALLALTLAAVAALALTPGEPTGPRDDQQPRDPAEAQGPEQRAISDRDLSLYPGSVFEVVTPAAVEPNTSDPGERPLPPRPLAGFPPVIAHGIDDFLPISRDTNYCVDCHSVETKEEGEPTPIPASHLAGEELAGARYLCTACHVAQTEATSLVENRLEEQPVASTEGSVGP